MKKVKVLEDKCIGCGACVAVDPEHFDFSDAGVSKVISEQNVEGNATLQEACDGCPVGAIEIFDGCENEKCTCNPCKCEGECKCNDVDKK